MYINDSRGIPHKLKDVAAVDHLIRLKNKNTSPWPVIEEIIRVWTERNPKEWKAFLVDIDTMRETRKESKYASSYDKITGGILRYTLDIPEKVIYMIHALYSTSELDMNRDFFQEFARRFPKMTVAQKQ